MDRACKDKFLATSMLACKMDACQNTRIEWQSRHQHKINYQTPTMYVSYFGHDLCLLFKLHQICSVDFHENDYNWCHKTSYFKAKMYPIRNRLGLRPDPSRELTALPKTQ